MLCEMGEYSLEFPKSNPKVLHGLSHVLRICNFKIRVPLCDAHLLGAAVLKNVRVNVEIVFNTYGKRGLELLFGTTNV